MTRCLIVVRELDLVPGADRAREDPHVGDLLARGPAFDLEDLTRDGTVGAAAITRDELGDGDRQRIDARPRDRGAEDHRVHERPLGLSRQLQPGREAGVGGVGRREVGGSRSKVTDRAHRDDCRCESLGDLLQHLRVARAAPVDLVDEDQGRDTQSSQRSHQDARLRLHTFDGRDHEHHTVEHRERPFHFGNEVGVTGRVDEVDGDVIDRERDDRGLDRDAALLLERERICLRRSLVDAPYCIDDTGGVEQPLGECGFTGVYMRQDPEVQRCHEALRPPGR